MAEERCHCHVEGWLFLLGVLAIVYGVVQYLLVVLAWPVYAAWLVGGILLLIVHWAKNR